MFRLEFRAERTVDPVARPDLDVAAIAQCPNADSTLRAFGRPPDELPLDRYCDRRIVGGRDEVCRAARESDSHVARVVVRELRPIP